LKFKIVILLILPFVGWSQNNFFTVHDYNMRSQGNLDIVEYEDEIVTLGSTICSTGECGILSKYNSKGELLFLKEIDNIDVNSYHCMSIRNDTIILMALSKYELGGRLQKYNTEGVLLLDTLISRDSALAFIWIADALYLEDYFYVAVDENYEEESRHQAIYKVDYDGNVVDYMRLERHFRGKILTLTQLNNGNLFV